MRILEQTGAIDVEPTDGGVVITQQSVCGEEPDEIFIPTPMVSLVCNAIRSVSQSKQPVKPHGR